MNVAFPGGGMGKRPKALCCYICGREYGTNSLRIHLPQCQKLWMQREALKPKHERRPLPRPPMDIDRALNGFGKGGAVDVQAYNDTAFRTFTDEALVPCEFCGRKFLPEKLPVHNRSCTRERPAARVMVRVPTQTAASAAGASASAAGSSSSPMTYQPHPPINPKPLPLSARGASDARGSHGTGTGIPRPAALSATAPLADSVPSERAVRFAVDEEKTMDVPEDEPADTAYEVGAEHSVPTRYNFEDHLDSEPQPITDMVQCSSCQRNFAADRIQKHERVCKGPTESKSRRSAYDPKKAIAEAEAQQRSKLETAEAASSKWRREHEEFQAAIRNGRLAEQIRARGGNIAKELPPPPPAENPDYITCPYCTRRFNQEAASRHIPHCRTAISRSRPTLRAGSGLGGGAGGVAGISGGGIGVTNAGRYMGASGEPIQQASPYQQSNMRSMHPTPVTANSSSGSTNAFSPRRPSLGGSGGATPGALSARNSTPTLSRMASARATPASSVPLQRMTSTRVTNGSAAPPLTQQSPMIQRTPSMRTTTGASTSGHVSPLRGIARDMGLGVGAGPGAGRASPGLMRSPSKRLVPGGAAPAAASPSPANRFCTSCGTGRGAADRFCGACGTRF